jgi:hypothetical protein
VLKAQESYPWVLAVNVKAQPNLKLIHRQKHTIVFGFHTSKSSKQESLQGKFNKQKVKVFFRIEIKQIVFGHQLILKVVSK